MIFVAFVASLGIVILWVVTSVTRPNASTRITGIRVADPYTPAITPDVGRRSIDSVPVDMRDAFVPDSNKVPFWYSDPVKFMSPMTVSLCVGRSVPIPTLPPSATARAMALSSNTCMIGCEPVCTTRSAGPVDVLRMNS